MKVDEECSHRGGTRVHGPPGHARGGYFSGQSALVSLSGAAPREAVLLPVVFQHATLRSFPGPDYPRALMGVIAHCRQALLDAGWHARRAKAFEGGKLAGARLTFDSALDALNLALEGKSAVVFEADSADEIHRALDFAEEFKLTPVVLGGRDAWKVKDRLKASDTAVILRLIFTEPDDKEKQLPARVREDRERKRKEEHARRRTAQGRRAVAFATHALPIEKGWEKFGPNLWSHRRGLRRPRARALRVGGEHPRRVRPGRDYRQGQRLHLVVPTAT